MEPINLDENGQAQRRYLSPHWFPYVNSVLKLVAFCIIASILIINLLRSTFFANSLISVPNDLLAQAIHLLQNIIITNPIQFRSLDVSEWQNNTDR